MHKTRTYKGSFEKFIFSFASVGVETLDICEHLLHVQKNHTRTRKPLLSHFKQLCHALKNSENCSYGSRDCSTFCCQSFYRRAVQESVLKMPNKKSKNKKPVRNGFYWYMQEIIPDLRRNGLLRVPHTIMDAVPVALPGWKVRGGS